MQRPIRKRIVDRGGGVLIRVVILIVVGFLIWKFAPLGFSSNPPAKQEPASIAVDGPTHLRPGSSYTYLVTLTYPRPLHPTSSYWVVAEIVEDGFGEPLLDRKVRIAMRAGSTTGKASFALSCTTDGDGRFVLRGDDGSSSSDRAWQIGARLQEQTNSKKYQSGSTLTVICADR